MLLRVKQRHCYNLKDIMLYKGVHLWHHHLETGQVRRQRQRSGRLHLTAVTAFVLSLIKKHCYHPEQKGEKYFPDA